MPSPHQQNRFSHSGASEAPADCGTARYAQGKLVPEGRVGGRFTVANRWGYTIWLCTLFVLASEAWAGGAQDLIHRSSFEYAGFVRLSQTDILFSAIGQVREVGATVTDGSGGQVDLPLRWESANPQVASVDANGVVTSVAAGATTIVVSVPGGLSQRLHVTTAKVAAGTTVVSADKLLTNPTVILEPLPGEMLGGQLRASFAPDTVLPEVGETLILSDWSYSGQVISIQTETDELIVVWETVTLYDKFESLQLRYEVPLTEFVQIPLPGATRHAGAGFIPRENQLPVFDCASPDPITLEANLTYALTAQILENSLQVVYFVDIVNFETGLSQLLVQGDLHIGVQGNVQVGGVIADKFECTLTLLKPFWPLGPVQLEIPIGLGFAFTPEVATTFSGDISGPIDATIAIGAQYLAGEFSFVNEVDIDSDQLAIDFGFPDVSTVEDTARVKGEFELFAFIKTEGALAIKKLAFLNSVVELLGGATIDDTRFGIRATMETAGLEYQVREPDFLPSADLVVVASHSVSDPQAAALGGWLGFALYAAREIVESELGLINWVADTSLPTDLRFYNWNVVLATLSKLPGGLLTASTMVTQVGQSVTLGLELFGLDSLNIPERLENYRLEGEAPNTTAQLVHTSFPLAGETAIEWEWTPNEKDLERGYIEFLPFVRTLLLPDISNKLDTMSTGITVSGGLVVTLDAPAEVEVGDSAIVIVRAGHRQPDDSITYGPGLDVSFNASLGSLASTSGVTDNSGYFTTVYTAPGTPGPESLSVVVSDSDGVIGNSGAGIEIAEASDGEGTANVDGGPGVNGQFDTYSTASGGGTEIFDEGDFIELSLESDGVNVLNETTVTMDAQGQSGNFSGVATAELTLSASLNQSAESTYGTYFLRFEGTAELSGEGGHARVNAVITDFTCFDLPRSGAVTGFLELDIGDEAYPSTVAYVSVPGHDEKDMDASDRDVFSVPDADRVCLSLSIGAEEHFNTTFEEGWPTQFSGSLRLSFSSSGMPGN